jgi:lycopene beta-cyclase
MTPAHHCERVIIAGGGLAGCLTALALAERRPEVPLLLIERGERLGGNHIWSFFGSDVAAEDWGLVEPLVAASWGNHEVRFPRRRRRIGASYHSIRSERLDAAVRERLGPERLRLGAGIDAVRADAVVLANGEQLKGAVIDARGAGDLGALELGWQKFLGVEFRFNRPHGIRRPMIMDATVEQLDGYRFVYLLPFSETELLVEDTYYSDGPELDVASLRERIAAYLFENGLPEGEAVREEVGVLPVAIGGDLDALLAAGGAAAKIGMRGGFFHPTTGYSLPDAVRVASAIARQPQLEGEALRRLTESEARRLWRERGFYRILNAMLFRAARPSERYKVLERFYGLSPALIGRFYAGRTTMLDKLRILSGRPPVPVGRALAALAGHRR